jgi:DNA-binding protein H-NS
VSERPGDIAAKRMARRYIASINIAMEQIMRKPRDFDSEQLKARKLLQLGELVIATGADGFDTEVLTGALLALVENKEEARKESWRKRGQAFFRSERRSPAQTSSPIAQSDQTGKGHAASR